ncbi:tryptophan synthase subunit alpha [Candidatus Gottesmanbacteria bacterium RIFCSPHIGHO2_02_FULL_39_14]|uniref:Tryptophan synthase alpha chain n=1 Tax=Candidatus Gottesmanbacteria bacterium RIFCSPHIGHO2_02_FULL_39_14 TaxID=1798383 RepID=A0A1F6A382_9BACT|nr:MAG: tryptophan synthase subunit alpha [Candidatus Gottesmanbacteria bacterium RIFCSPHIGHO2_02_FULL_39_14]
MNIKKILMTHFYYGDVSPEFSEDLAMRLISSGSDILEIGIPYSDPVCDGPVFQKSCRQALENGITPMTVLAGIKKIREKTIKPIYLTSYFGPVFKLGVERFLKMADDTGVNGLIIPDLPLEEQENFSDIFNKYNLSIIQFATVYSDQGRLEKIINKSNDFIYGISHSGVTGDRGNEREIQDLIVKIKNLTDKKIYCGFGIKTAMDAKKIIDLGADGVIVGSAIAEIYQNSKDPQKSLEEIEDLVRNIQKKVKLIIM